MMAMRSAVLALFIALLAVAPVAAQPSDPVASFEAMIQFGTQRVGAAQPPYLNSRRQLWAKRRFAVSEVKYDVKRTDSLVAPIIGLLSYVLVASQTELVPTESQATHLTEFGDAAAVRYRISMRYSHLDGQWRFVDGEYQPLDRTIGKLLITPDTLAKEPNALPFAAVRLLVP